LYNQFFMKMNRLTLSFAVMLSVAFSCVLLTSCNKNNDPYRGKGHKAYEIKKFANNPYLAEVWWGNDYNFEDARATLNNKYNQPTVSGGCSSWHKGNFHGRNIDWMMRDYATIIIHMPKGKDVKYASVSLLAGNPTAVKSLIDNNTVVPAESRNIMAAAVVDGMNEKGVAINHNIVPYEGADYEKNGYITSVMLCRYILDNCASAEEARALLEKTSVTQAIVAKAHDYSHFMVSDPECTYVFEWINGKFVPTKFKSKGENFVSENGQNAIMTNYFVGKAEEYGLGTQEFFKNHLYGAGVERTQIIDEQLKSANTVTDHLNICKKVWYKQFCYGTTSWYSENAGAYGYDESSNKAYYTQGDEKVYIETDNIYDAAKAYFASPENLAYYEDFKANGTEISPDNDYWYTQHSVVYDLKNLKGYLIMQEGTFSNEVIEFGIE